MKAMIAGVAIRALYAGVVGLGAICGEAHAADLQVRAPALDALPAPSDIHGFFDLTFANDYITPRGNLVTNTGLTTQVGMGLVFDLYKNPGGVISDVSFTIGTWTDLWSNQNDASVGSWNELDWFADLSFRFAQYWIFGLQYGEFLPPAHDQPNSFPNTEHYLQFALTYDDSHWQLPILFNPYVKVFYETSGSSTVVLGKNGDTYDVEFGVVPSVDMKNYWGLPIILMAPSWITVGPSTFWDRGVGTNFCGPVPAPFVSGPAGSACAASNVGLVTTGLTAKMAVDGLIPTRLGNWFIKGGFQYYHIVDHCCPAISRIDSVG
jgi:hypothetical protein